MPITNYMGLFLPTVGTTVSPTWAIELNAALTKIDSHNHTSPDNGVKVPSAGININADLAINGYNLSLPRAVRLTDLVSVPNAVADTTTIAAVDGEFYFIDGSGNQVQITSGGSLNAASLGAIGGDYGASTALLAFYNSNETFVFTKDTNESAPIDCGPVSIRDVAASANKITLKSPVYLASSYDLTLPTALPSTLTRLLSVSTTGVMSYYNIGSVTVDTTNNVSGVANLDMTGILTVGESASITGEMASGSINTGTIISGAINSGAITSSGLITCDTLVVNTPKTQDYIENLGLSLSAGTLTVTASDGTSLSSSNKGLISVPSSTGGRSVVLKVTAPITVNDDSHASSDFTNLGFGVVETVDWAQDVPFFLYVANRNNTNIDGVDGSSVLFISRIPNLQGTPSDSNNIGDTGAIPVNDSQNVILILDDVTIANYTSLPCRLIGGIRMRWSTTTDDWTIQTLSHIKDGFGDEQLDKLFNVQWVFPQLQMSATSGYFSTVVPVLAGVVPQFSTYSYYYYLSRNGRVTCSLYCDGDGGTEGSGAAPLYIHIPLLITSTNSYNILGTVFAFGNGGNLNGGSPNVVLNQNPSLSYGFPVTLTTSQFINSRYIVANLDYYT